MRQRSRAWFLGVAVLAPIVLAVLAAEALGCPNCKDAVDTSDPEGLNLARGYFYSILLMLAMPFTLVSSFGAYVWREMRRQKAAAAAGETQEHSAP
jgi:heme/copper-type cytochrome/quinol oxidase subunit 2